MARDSGQRNGDGQWDDGSQWDGDGRWSEDGNWAGGSGRSRETSSRAEISDLDLVPPKPMTLRGPVIGTAVAVVAVVLGLGVLVPRWVRGDDPEQGALPPPVQIAIATGEATPTGPATATVSPGRRTQSPAVTPTGTVTSTPTATRKGGATRAAAGTTGTNGAAEPAAQGGGKATTTTTTTRATTSTTTQAAAQEWGSLVVNSTSVLRPGENWHTDRIRLALTSGGNVTLTDENGDVTWSSGTSGGEELVFQADGNFVLYDDDNGTLWSTSTMNNDGAVLTLGSGGDVSISLSGTTLWSVP
ncbi:hypothetical protein KIH74_14675 [Kineosporia sp. J2-2]|uniref:Bulb-type lectin domain-containing protein n=1 Tax=Kineosporia corallincola TaxID=2835133 RepID=A0ABS5TGG7_9ACTN|nr:hypothetical protein [Kineosporia corallincola]MBT0770182.1 hypothetical protein [Kineosporia corallincola]